MKIIYLLFVIVLPSLMICANSVSAQTNRASVEFQIDGKKSEQHFRVFLSVEGSTIFEPAISNNSFELPLELQNAKFIQLRFVSGEHDLSYDRVHISKFDGEMIFGVDTPPFDEEFSEENSEIKGKLILIYYLKTGKVKQVTRIYID